MLNDKKKTSRRKIAEPPLGCWPICKAAEGESVGCTDFVALLMVNSSNAVFDWGFQMTARFVPQWKSLRILSKHWDIFPGIFLISKDRARSKGIRGFKGIKNGEMDLKRYFHLGRRIHGRTNQLSRRYKRVSSIAIWRNASYLTLASHVNDYLFV